MEESTVDNSMNELIADRFGKNWSPEEERTLLDSYRQFGPDWPRIEALLPLRKGIISKWKRLVANGNKEAIAIQKYWRSVRDQLVYQQNINKALSPDGTNDDGTHSTNDNDGSSSTGGQGDHIGYPLPNDDGTGEGEITVDADGNMVTVTTHLTSSPTVSSSSSSTKGGSKEALTSSYGTRSTRGNNGSNKRGRNDDDFEYYSTSHKSHRGGNNVRNGNVTGGINASVYGLSTEDISALLNESHDNTGGDKSDDGGGDALDRAIGGDGNRSGLDALIESTSEQLAEMENHPTMSTTTGTTTTTTTVPGSSARGRRKGSQKEYQGSKANAYMDPNGMHSMTGTNLANMMNNLDPTLNPMLNIGTPVGTPMNAMFGGGNNPMMMNSNSANLTANPMMTNNAYYPGYNYGNVSMFPYAPYNGNSTRFFPQSSAVPTSFYPTNFPTAITTTTVDPTVAAAMTTTTTTVVPSTATDGTTNSIHPTETTHRTTGTEGHGTETNGLSLSSSSTTATATATVAATNIPLPTDASGTNTLKIDPNAAIVSSSSSATAAASSTSLTNAQLANAMVLQDSGRFKRVTIVIDVPVPNLPSNFVSSNTEETEQWISQYAESYAENFAHAYAKAMQGAYVRGYMDFMQVSSPQHYGEVMNMISPTMGYATMAQNVFAMDMNGTVQQGYPTMTTTDTMTGTGVTDGPSTDHAMTVEGHSGIGPMTTDTGTLSSASQDPAVVTTTSLTVDTGNHDGLNHASSSSSSIFTPATTHSGNNSNVTNTHLQEMRIEQSPTAASVSLNSANMHIDSLTSLPTHNDIDTHGLTPQHHSQPLSHPTVTSSTSSAFDHHHHHHGMVPSVGSTPTSILSPSHTNHGTLDKTGSSGHHSHHDAGYTTLHSH